MRQALFPLNTLLFPGRRLTLQLFEPRYLDLVTRCMRQDSGFVVAGLESGSEVALDNDDEPTVYPVGTLARIVDWNAEKNGKLGLTVEGGQRVHLSDIATESDYLMQAEVEPIADDIDMALPEMYAGLAGLLKQLAKHPAIEQLGEVFDYTSALSVGYSLSHYLPVDLHLKYPLLLETDALKRLESLQALTDELSGANIDID